MNLLSIEFSINTEFSFNCIERFLFTLCQTLVEGNDHPGVLTGPYLVVWTSLYQCKQHCICIHLYDSQQLSGTFHIHISLPYERQGRNILVFIILFDVTFNN